MSSQNLTPSRSVILSPPVLSLQRLFYREYPVKVSLPGNIMVSPCRSLVSHVSSIGEDAKIPGKKHFGQQSYFSLTELVEQDETAAHFTGGQLVNLYLAPWDYHFLIFPSDARVKSFYFLDGRNIPVVTHPNAILKNEKLVTLLETPMGFSYCLIMVASFMVGGIEHFFELEKTYRRTDRFGRFHLGSTVVLLFPPGAVEILCRQGQKLELGTAIASIK